MNYDGILYWPNGLGHSECTEEYEETYYALEAARKRGDENEIWKLDNKLNCLLAEGHIGKRVTYDKADPLAAMLGGSPVQSKGDGTWEVVNVPGSRITIADPDKVLE